MVKYQNFLPIMSTFNQMFPKVLNISLYKLHSIFRTIKEYCVYIFEDLELDLFRIYGLMIKFLYFESEICHFASFAFKKKVLQIWILSLEYLVFNFLLISFCSLNGFPIVTIHQIIHITKEKKVLIIRGLIFLQSNFRKMHFLHF